MPERTHEGKVEEGIGGRRSSGGTTMTDDPRPPYARAYRSHGYHSDARTGDVLRALEVISAQLASGLSEIIDRLDRDYRYRVDRDEARHLARQVPFVRPQQLVPEDWDTDGDGWAEDVGPDSPTLEDER